MINIQKESIYKNHYKKEQYSSFSGKPNVSRVFSTLEKRPLIDLVARDILCYNIPQFSLARTKEELFDMAPNSLALTGITVGSMLVLPPLLSHPVSWITKVPVDSLRKELTPELIQKMTPKVKLARLAVAGGFFFPFAAAFMASPFGRNWLTLKRTKTADFDQIIGVKDQNKGSKDLQEKLDYQKSMVAKVLGIGIALGAATLLGFASLSRSGKNMSGKGKKVIDKLFENFSLKGQKSNEVSGSLATMLFWLIPPYLGWALAARSKNEKIENAVKGTNSVLWFCLFTPMIVKDFFLKKFMKADIKTGAEGLSNRWVRSFKGVIPAYQTIEKLEEPLKQQGLKIKNRYTAASWIIPVLMLATTPQLINIYFTKKRAAKQTEKQNNSYEKNIYFGYYHKLCEQKGENDVWKKCIRSFLHTQEA